MNNIVRAAVDEGVFYTYLLVPCTADTFLLHTAHNTRPEYRRSRNIPHALDRFLKLDDITTKRLLKASNAWSESRSRDCSDAAVVGTNTPAAVE